MAFAPNLFWNRHDLNYPDRREFTATGGMRRRTLARSGRSRPNDSTQPARLGCPCCARSAARGVTQRPSL